MSDDNLATELLHTLKASRNLAKYNTAKYHIRESKISLIFFLKSLHKNVDILTFMCYNIDKLKERR